MSTSVAPDLDARAAMHAALGDPHRLAVCDALEACDRSPSELGALLGMPLNLLAHHLLTLTKAGLVETVRSSGDRRRRYVRLRRPASEVASSHPRFTAESVLFVCTGNSARSQLAAALWRTASAVAADSAGTHPASEVHPLAVRVAARHGLDLSHARPQGFEDVAMPPSLIVTVCDEANEELRVLDVPRLHWSLPDPAASARVQAFEATYEELRARVAGLAALTQGVAA